MAEIEGKQQQLGGWIPPPYAAAMGERRGDGHARLGLFVRLSTYIVYVGLGNYLSPYPQKGIELWLLILSPKHCSHEYALFQVWRSATLDFKRRHPLGSINTTKPKGLNFTPLQPGVPGWDFLALG